jgi:hypothetical protein
MMQPKSCVVPADFCFLPEGFDWTMARLDAWCSTKPYPVGRGADGDVAMA